MKTIAVLGVLALALSGTIAADAQTGASATVTERETATALASVQTPIECDDGSTATVETSIVVSSRIESVRSAAGSSEATSLVLDWFEFNPCTGRLSHTARIIDAPDSEHRGLRSASIVGSFELVDVTVPVGTVDIDLEWSGTGPVARTSTHDSTQEGGATIITALQEGRRAGELSGSVTLNDVELTLSGPGELVSTRTLEITLPR